ncbi:MAG: hypothetical protein JWP40_4298 [Blastococcus sp.]|nr:hypothetical protein [Blastococcus sp.]
MLTEPAVDAAAAVVGLADEVVAAEADSALPDAVLDDAARPSRLPGGVGAGQEPAARDRRPTGGDRKRIGRRRTRVEPRRQASHPG